MQQHELDRYFLHVQNLILSEFIKCIPENQQEPFLNFYAEEIATNFRKIHYWIEGSKE